ncbi:hypothetical protein [Erwinia rhapontici]|uniref:hypothetical protein n=2 Tax=Erwinia rhapontici TaxID=55212 RepID=UPI001331696C|nr:hypothetical protein [Erwinia rhapontici]MBP2156563.1 hypothetical protein [Erwinia rhapontici]
MRRAIAFRKRILGRTGRREGITCCGAVVIALADPSRRWSKMVKPHVCFLDKTRQSVFKSEYLSGSGPASLKFKNSIAADRQIKKYRRREIKRRFTGIVLQGAHSAPK